MPVIVLAGEEDFELYRRVNKLKAELVEPDWAAFNFVRLNGSNLRDVIDAAATLPFGSGRKLILVDRCDLFTKKRSKSGEETEKSPAGSEKAVKQLLEDLDQALGNMVADTYLVFACPHNFDSTLRASKVVSKHASLEEFPKEKYWPGSRSAKLVTWLSKEAKLHGATMDEDAMDYLLESTEANLRQMSSEIAKAATFALPETRITLDVISAVSSHHSHVFALLDSWAHGMHEQALTSLKELLSRESGLPIIRTMHTVLSKWIQLKALAAREESALPVTPGARRREIPAKDLARRIAGELRAHPFAVEMDLKRISRLDADRLAAKRVQLCQLEHKVKTGQMPDHHALTIFLTTA